MLFLKTGDGRSTQYYYSDRFLTGGENRLTKLPQFLFNFFKSRKVECLILI